MPLDSERFGEPGLLRLFTFLRGSECLGRPDGVLVPFDEAPEGSFEADSNLALFLASSSFLRSSPHLTYHHRSVKRSVKSIETMISEHTDSEYGWSESLL